MEHVEVEGLEIAYQRAGTGPPLVLVHGALVDSRMWRPQLEGMSDEFTVVAWDAPGCGRSSDPPETFRLPDFADCLAGFIERLALDRPHVLGLSFGGGLAIQFYARHPALPRTLVLAAAYAGWAGSLPPEVVAQRLAKALRESELLPEEFLPGWIPDLLTDAAPPEVADELLTIMLECRPAGMRAMAHAFAEADLRDVLPHIAVPTLLLYGDADRRSPLDVAEALRDDIPGSKLVVLPGVGHASNLEAPEQFNQAVRSFLRGL